MHECLVWLVTVPLGGEVIRGHGLKSSYT